jgi:HemY protein
VLAHLLAAGSLHRLQDRAPRRQLRRLSPAGPGRCTRCGRRCALLAAEWAVEDRDAPARWSCWPCCRPGVARRTQALRLKLQATRLARQPLEALHTARLLAKHQAFARRPRRACCARWRRGARQRTTMQQLRRLWSSWTPPTGAIPL